jgi:hypothetical protein
VVVTAMVPAPPPAGNTDDAVAALTWHFWADGDTIAVDVSVEVHAEKAVAARNRPKIVRRIRSLEPPFAWLAPEWLERPDLVGPRTP